MRCAPLPLYSPSSVPPAHPLSASMFVFCLCWFVAPSHSISSPQVMQCIHRLLKSLRLHLASDLLSLMRWAAPTTRTAGWDAVAVECGALYGRLYATELVIPSCVFVMAMLSHCMAFVMVACGAGTLCLLCDLHVMSSSLSPWRGSSSRILFIHPLRFIDFYSRLPACVTDCVSSALHRVQYTM